MMVDACEVFMTVFDGDTPTSFCRSLTVIPDDVRYVAAARHSRAPFGARLMALCRVAPAETRIPGHEERAAFRREAIAAAASEPLPAKRPIDREPTAATQAIEARSECKCVPTKKGPLTGRCFAAHPLTQPREARAVLAVGVSTRADNMWLAPPAEWRRRQI